MMARAIGHVQPDLSLAEPCPATRRSFLALSSRFTSMG